MIQILHAADLHLDSPFAALPPSQAAARRNEQRQVLKRLIGLCGEHGCDLLLLAGDLFDSAQVYRDTLELLCQLLEDCPAQVFIAPGNHDCLGPGSVYLTTAWPKNVHIFPAGGITSVRLDEPTVTVYGAAFPAASSPALLQDFHADSDGRPAVMVLHGELGAAASAYNPISEEQVRTSGLAYLALGHVHKREVRRIGSTTVGNPGCAMGRGFDETGPKGALLVRLEEADCAAEFVPLGAREYRVLEAPVSEQPLDEILRLLPEGTERDIYRIILTGECGALRLDELRQALAPRFFSLELLDRTTPPVSLWAGMEEDNLRGVYLRRIREIYDNASGQAQEDALAAARIGLALLDGREVPAL